ncbi:hypothetical protein QZH41_018234 [Actinostola sp. cb2023]|nr:hypothetical protein QZH41_018234 [Actinostola sp. cb2023]
MEFVLVVVAKGPANGKGVLVATMLGTGSDGAIPAESNAEFTIEDNGAFIASINEAINSEDATVPEGEAGVTVGEAATKEVVVVVVGESVDELEDDGMKLYPKELENALEKSLEAMKSSVDDEETVLQFSQWTLEFVSLALSGFKSKVVPESSATLMLSLHHPKSDVRQMAVKHLHNLIKDKQVSQDDSEFISGALLARLSDDDLMVVDSVLDMHQVLVKYLPGETLAQKLLSLLELTKWSPQCDKAVSLLMSSALVDQNEELLDGVVCGLITQLLLNGQTHKQAVNLARQIAQSGLSEKHFILKDMKTFVKKKEWKTCEESSNPDDLAIGNQSLISWLADNLASVPVNQLLAKIKLLSKYSEGHSDTVFALILNCVLGKLVTKATVAKHLDIVEVILKLLLVSLQDVEKQEGSYSVSTEDYEPTGTYLDGIVPATLMSVFITHWTKNRIRRTNMAKGAVYLWLLSNTIRSLPVNKTIAKGCWWGIKDENSAESQYTKVESRYMHHYHQAFTIIRHSPSSLSGIVIIIWHHGIITGITFIIWHHHYLTSSGIIRHSPSSLSGIIIIIIWHHHYLTSGTTIIRHRHHQASPSSSGLYRNIKNNVSILLLIFEVLVRGTNRGKYTVHCSTFKQLIEELIKCHLSSNLCLLKFLSLIWSCRSSVDIKVSPSLGCPVLLQHHSLQIGNTCLSSLNKHDVKEICEHSSSVVMSLLVPLCSPVSSLRKDALACLKTLKTGLTTTLRHVYPVGTLVGLLVESSEEIDADHEHLQRILTSAFSCLSPNQEKSTPKTKSKKSSEEKLLEGLLDYLVRCTVSQETPIYVQKCLLVLMSGVVTQSMLKFSLPWLESLATKAKISGLSADENVCLNLLIKKFSPITAEMLESEPKTCGVLKMVFGLKSSVCSGHHPPVSHLLDQITEAFFQAISSKTVQQDIVSLLLDTLLGTKNMTLVNKAKHTLIQVTLTAEHVIDELCKLSIDHDAKAPKKKKARKTISHEESTSEETLSWQRITIILEILQQKDNIVDEQQLIPTLFAILSRCVEADGSEQVNFDYIKQLVFTEILNICQRVSKDGSHVSKDTLPEDKFNVELIVQCIRVSENPQTHHHALLLLAAAAKLFPEKVLHNVMSIFTFMGASMLRQDDSYSFQVISKTVETVIPALIQAGEKQKLPKLSVKGSPALSLDDIVAMVTRVFVDASPHIPEHRRLAVFSHLVSTVGSSKFLHVTLALLIERYVVHSSDPSENDEETVRSPLDLEFCLALCQEFDPSVQVQAMLSLLKYIAQLPAEKPDVAHRPRANRRSTALFNTPSPLFDVHSRSSKHLRQFKFVTIGFIPTVLSTESFASKVNNYATCTVPLESFRYECLVEELLTFVTVTAQHAEKHNQGTTGKFWRALLHRIYHLIDKVNELLPPNVFINVIRRLLHNSNATVRRKSMDLLNTKLGQSKAIADQVNELVKLVDDLLSLVNTSDGSETPVNRQTALYSLKLLARILSEQQPHTFTKVLEACITVFTNKNENSQVSSNAILCLGEVCAGLKASTISYFPQFMPSLLSLLEKTGHHRNVVMLLCAVVTVHKVTETLPNFLSPYLVQILLRVTCPALNGVEDKSEEQKKDSTVIQLHDRLSVLRRDLARVITPRVLIPAVSQCYDDITSTNHMAIPLLMNIVHKSVTCMTKHDVTTYSEHIFKFLLVALDFRVTQPQCEPELLDQIESDVINSFCELIMKMSEATFRPVFLKVPRNRCGIAQLDVRMYCDNTPVYCTYVRPLSPIFYVPIREILFFVSSIAGKLKGLMVLFAGYIIKNCSTLLDSNNLATAKEPFYVTTDSNGEETADHRKSCLLIQYILGCLRKCLCYATQGFVDKERFSCLMQPIVDQLENQLGNAQEFQDRISKQVVPCLAQLAVAAGNDTDWKPLNYQVLLKTRHSSSQVRFAALKALEEFYRQLGEEFVVVLLPESIPFLAELMEGKIVMILYLDIDECVEVEQQCQHVVQQI